MTYGSVVVNSLVVLLNSQSTKTNIFAICLMATKNINAEMATKQMRRRNEMPPQNEK